MAEWFYIDDDGNEQGPFSHDNICAWFRDAYFDASTRIRHADNTTLTALSDTPAFATLFQKDDDESSSSSASASEGSLEPLLLDGVAVPPPPGWHGEPIVSNAAAVQQAMQEINAMLAAAAESAAQPAAAATGPWTDAEFEHWSALARQAIATPQALPPAIWQQLERERRERQRIAAAAAKYIKDHQTKGLKRKKYSWSSGFKGI